MSFFPWKRFEAIQKTLVPRSACFSLEQKRASRKDLFVADASLFPKSVEVNPYLTVMALANRVAEEVKRDLTVL